MIGAATSERSWSAVRVLVTTVALVVTAVLSTPPAASAQDVTKQLHELRWFVHDSMIDVGAGRGLDYYQGLIEDAVDHATGLLQGLQGPVDSPCCVELSTVSVQTFSGAGLDVPSSKADWDALRSNCGSGSCAYLLESLAYCGGPTATAVGCADTPACSSDPDDDPLLVLVVTMASHDFDLLGDTLLHERGHAACLSHTCGDVCEVMPSCEVMRSSGGGGCLSAGECDALIAGRTGSDGVCSCHGENETTLLDGMLCSEGGGGGVCSGGRCGSPLDDAGQHLVASAASGLSPLAAPDDAMMFSGLTGGWDQAGQVGGAMAPRGLAYAASRDLLYAVAAGAGGDELLTLSREDGSVTSHVGDTGLTGLVALAFDPGLDPGAGDDVLYALRNDGSGFEDLISIDPDTGAASYLGGLSLGMGGDGFESLAFDSERRVLYTATPLGGGSLLSIDPSCPGFCSTRQVATVDVPRYDPGLAYSEETGLLYLVGSQAGNRVLYNTIDPATSQVSASIGIQALSVGGLAAVPVPEPQVGSWGALACVGWMVRRRRVAALRRGQCAS